MGANMQPQGQVQTLTRMLLVRQQPQAACDAPRGKWNVGLELELEPGMPPAVARPSYSGAATGSYAATTRTWTSARHR